MGFGGVLLTKPLLVVEPPAGKNINHLEVIVLRNSLTWNRFQRDNPHLVGGIPTPLKNMSASVGMIIPIYGKIKLFQTTRDNMDMNHLRKMWPESKVLDQVQSFRAQPGIRPSVHQCCDLLRWKITSSNGTSYASWWNSPFQIPEPSKWFFPFNNNDIVSVWTLSFIRQLLQILVIDGWDSPWKTPFFLGVTLADSISIIHVGYCGKPCLKPTMTMVGIPLKMMTWGWFMAARVSHIKHHYTSYASRSLSPRLDLDFGPALAWTNPVTKVIFSC